MDTKYKARLNAVYFILAGASALLLGLGKHLSLPSEASLGLLVAGGILLFNGILSITRPSKHLPLLSLLILAAITLISSSGFKLPVSLEAHWAYILPLYLFSQLPFKQALILILGYSLLFNITTTVQLAGIERLQVLYLFWSATSIACVFIFTSREKQLHLQKLVSIDAESSAYNTQQLYDDLPRELARADRENTSLALLCFKGRSEYPELTLKKSTELLNSVLRPFDRIYRVDDYLIALTPSGSFKDSVSICYQYYDNFNPKMNLAAVIPGEHETEQELLNSAAEAIAFASRQDVTAPLYLKSDTIDIQNEKGAYE